MQQDWSRITSSKLSIMELPYKIHQDLSHILDPLGTKDWKHLVSCIPKYTAQDVLTVEIEGAKPGSSCTRQLLQDLDNRGYDVDELKNMIIMSGNVKALGCLREGLEHNQLMGTSDYTTRPRDQHGRMKTTPALTEQCVDVHRLQRRAMTINQTIKYNLIQKSGTRETLGTENPIQQPRDQIGLQNPDKGRRKTLTIDNPMQKPKGKIGLQNTDQREIGPFSMDNSIHPQKGKISIQSRQYRGGTLGTLTKDNPIQEPRGKFGRPKPDQGTRETLGMDNPIQQPRCKTGLQNPDQEAIGILPINSPIQPSKGNIGLQNQGQGTRETLEMDNTIQHTRCKTGLQIPDQGAIQTLTMENPIQQPKGKTGLKIQGQEAADTLTMDNPIQQPKDEIGLHNPDLGTLRINSVFQQPRGKISLPFPKQETRHDVNRPIENDENQYQEAHGQETGTREPRDNVLHERTSRDTGFPSEHENNQRQLPAGGNDISLNFVYNLFQWMMTCGSQNK